MPRPRTIQTSPYKSSNLSIPPSPFSPRLPISPPASPDLDCRRAATRATVRHGVRIYSIEVYGPPPPDPMKWMWQCHQCNRVYALSVTRRCLDDGHFFCAGTVTWKKGGHGERARKVVRSCASEFDYQGWKAYGSWRRRVQQQMKAVQQSVIDYGEEVEGGSAMAPQPLFATRRESDVVWYGSDWGRRGPTTAVGPSIGKKDCWNTCDYPSDCRWGAKYGVKSPTTPTSAVGGRTLSEDGSAMAITDKALHIECAKGSSGKGIEAAGPTSQEARLTLLSEDAVSPTDVLESAVRRKRRSQGYTSSPLGSNPPSPAEVMNPNVSAATDFEMMDVVMDQSRQDTMSDSAAPAKVETFKGVFDELQSDLRKDIARLGAQIVSNMRSTAGLDVAKNGKSYARTVRPTLKKSFSSSSVKSNYL